MSAFDLRRTAANSSRLFWMIFSAALLISLLLCMPVLSQTTASQGSIQGTVSDQTNAVVTDATITITSRTTGQVVTVKTSSAGTYNSGGLPVGDYLVRVQAKGFKTAQLTIAVQIAVTSSGNVKLEVGQETTTIDVQTSAIAVNTEQSTVQGVLNAEQIDNMPVNGRSFLDLAQLEPGVQMQDGGNFDPTKVGYNSLSINGDYGRTPRIEVDGLDVSDETVGTTTQNVALSSIQEFNIGRSSFDISSEITGTGTVNVATRSGTNDYHGQAFYQFRDYRAGFADLPGAISSQFQRNQFGGRFGGAIIKDKLFFFIDSERLKQDSADAVVVGPPFQALTQGIDSPFKVSEVSGRLDWQATSNIRAFFKYAYDWNYSTASAGYGFSLYANRDYTPNYAAGIDINQGNWSHTIRMGFFKFHNQIIGATNSQPASINPFPLTEVGFNDTSLTTGPNNDAPQQTLQTNKQIKYDASRVWGAHIIRFGATLNGIVTGGFASFNGLGPFLNTYVNAAGLSAGVQNTPFYSCGLTNFAGCSTNIGDYPLTSAYIGNGQGFSDELPAFGYPAGGLFDDRLEAYVGDSWKIKPNLTVNYGLRYLRDTGRTDADLAPIPCSATTLITCTGNLLDQWGPGLGNRIRQPNLNFAPQIGFAWDPWHDGKTSIRGGGGLYYENNIFENVSYERENKLATGLFNQVQYLNCSAGASFGSVSFAMPVPGTTQPNYVSTVDGYDLATQVCYQALGPSSVNAEGAAKSIADLQAQYIAATAAVGAAGQNPNFVGNTLTLGYPYYPNFRTARSYQMNLGFERQLGKGGVLSVDYLRNIGLHFQVGIDVNHDGDSRYLNLAAAQNAIATTLAACGVAAIDDAITACPGIYGVGGGGASINDFAGFGLDSGTVFYSNYCGGSSPWYCGISPDQGAAFPGINPNVGNLYMNYPMGRSVYDGLQSEYRLQMADPFRGVKNVNLQINYTLSRFESNNGYDQHFTTNAWDFRSPTAFMGPTLEDRTHQFKFGAIFDFAHHGPRLSLIGGFASPQPSDLRTPVYTNVGEIFRSNLTGDGQTIGAFLNTADGVGHPGTFMRSITPKNLDAYLQYFNNTVAGTITPAGEALVSAGLMTPTQLTQLGAVVQPIQVPTGSNAGNGYYKDVDTVLSWPFKIREGISILPSISFFNVFNFVNYGTLGGLTGGPGAINGTPAGVNDYTNTIRIGRGSGVFAVGAPREAEFGLRIDF
jgi:hypothetical protein